ncbi:MAG: amidohydrolase family protein [Kiloniellales bacterium]
MPLPPPDFQVHKQHSDLSRPTRAPGTPYDGPIVDTHAHVMNRVDGGLRGILPWMDRTGVERLILLPTPNEGIFRDREENARNRRRFLELAGERGGRLCGSTYLTQWMNGAYRTGYQEAELEKRLERLRQELDGGTCLGVGEIGPYHFEKKPGQAIIEFPLNFEPVLAVAGIAAERNRWLDLHAEPVTPDGRSVEDALFGGIALLYRRFPNLKLILSHTGMTNPLNARALLETYPELMMNLKMVRPGGRLTWDHLEPISNAEDRLYEDWARLMEDMPERFMVGTDARFGTRQYAGKRYGRTIAGLRRVLGSLDRPAADLIAHGNARRAFKASASAPSGEAATKSPTLGEDRGRKKRRKKRRP